MILSILSDWKRTIRSLYLPIGTHWFQHLNSSLPSIGHLFSHITPLETIEFDQERMTMKRREREGA